VDQEVVADATPAWEKRIGMMYHDRVGELKRQRMYPYAQALASFFPNGKARDFEAIESVIRARDPDADSMNVIDRLEALGYIWETADEAMQYEPGIPSLMDYVSGRVLELEEPRPERSIDDMDLEL
jgi:hypothetical protein